MAAKKAARLLTHLHGAGAWLLICSKSTYCLWVSVVYPAPGQASGGEVEGHKKVRKSPCLLGSPPDSFIYARSKYQLSS